MSNQYSSPSLWKKMANGAGNVAARLALGKIPAGSMVPNVAPSSEQESAADAPFTAVDYQTARRALADDAVAETATLYDTAVANAEKQYEASAQSTEDSYRSMYDTNVVNELIARRHAEEAIANAGLQNSGLNATQQTAVSLQRGAADFNTTAQKQQAVDAIMRELDAVRAEYEATSAAKQSAIRQAADEDILSFEREQASVAADAEQAAAQREHEIFLQYLKHMQEMERDDIETAYVGTADAVKNLWSPNAVKVNAQAILHVQGAVQAENFLMQSVNNGRITEEQKAQIMQTIGLTPVPRPSEEALKTAAAHILNEQGVVAAKDYLDQVYKDGLVDYSTVRRVMVALKI